jgi:hypothetical protein
LAVKQSTTFAPSISAISSNSSLLCYFKQLARVKDQ